MYSREQIREIEDNTWKFVAKNYEPLPIVIERGEGVWLFGHHKNDVRWRKFLDMFGAYAVNSWGYTNPRILSAFLTQATKIGVTSRGVLTENLPQFAQALADLADLSVSVRHGGVSVLLAITGREAVEDAIKIARRWGYRRKGLRKDSVEIIACTNNFHGRGLTHLACSTEERYRAGFGPFPPGFRTVPFGDALALERAITPRTAAFLVEPIQGEGGVFVPPKGYLQDVQRICRRNNVLFIVDEIQTGLGRTGKNFCYMHEEVVPDMVVVGKALGGGYVPSSAVIAREEIMDVIGVGDHGSTFAGNPIQCAVGLAVMALLREENLAARAAEVGNYLMSGIRRMSHPLVKEVRGMGLLVGIEFLDGVSIKEIRLKLLEKGVLAGLAHNVLRFSPPLTITPPEIDFALEQLDFVLDSSG